MHKDLELAVGLRANGTNLGEREFTGEDHPIDAEALRDGNAFGVGDAHLGAAINPQTGSNLASHLHYGEILDDDGIGSGLGNRC
jgi:hypothetical protein